LLSISAVLPALPGFPSPPNRAPWPVWRGSAAGPVRFTPLSRKQAARLWHQARRWDRETRQPGRHGGIIGRTALAALYALLFDFLNHRTGRCDPSLEAIAAKAGCCRRAVVDALARLRDLGLLSWQRRCEETRDAEGRFRLRQRTNAYGLLPPSQWVGYRDTDPPPPDSATLGAPERVPDPPLEAAVAELTHGQRMASLAALDADPRDALARTLAAFGRAIDEREAAGIIGVHELPRNPARDSNYIGTDRFAAPEPAPLPPNTDLNTAKVHWLRVLLSADPAS
jgi:hypothetical protein